MNADASRSRTAFVWVGVIAPLSVLALAAALILAWMPELPDPIAIHWGSSGADGFAPTWSYVPQILGIGAGVVILMAALAVFAHRLPQSSTQPAIGPWSATTRFMAALNLGSAALIAFIAVWGAAIQRGLSDAADAPNVIGWTWLGFALMVVLGGAGWLLQPKSPARPDDEGVTAGSIPLAETERAAWFGTASMARIGVIVLGVSLAVLVATVVFLIAQGSDGWWITGAMAVVLTLLICTMLVFRVRVNADGLRVRSIFGWPNTRIPLDRIAKVETVQLDPMAEFGGWGWRISTDGRRGVVLRAGDALQITQTNGRVFVVTVDGASDAAAVLETLRTHAGNRRP